MAVNYRKVTEFPDLETFRQYLEHENIKIGFAPGQEAMKQNIDLYGKTLNNRWAILPMEGWDCDADGVPTEFTLRRWKNFAASGASLIAGVEAAAVMHEGRSNPRQLMVGEKSLPVLAESVKTMRAIRKNNFGAEAVIGLQLTHSGRYAHPNEDAKLESRTAYSHPLLDKKFNNNASNVVTDSEVAGIVEAFVNAAKMAQAAGYDFVDIKQAHGYLGHEFLSAYDRPGAYGGSFENRTRFFREIVEGIKRDCPGLGLGCRLSIFDILPFIKGEDKVGKPMAEAGSECAKYAFGSAADGMNMDENLTETVEFVRLLEKYGFELIVGTIGSPYYNVHMQRPAWYAVADGYLMPENPLYNVSRHIAAAKRLKELCPNIKLVASGLTALQEYLPGAAEYIVENNIADFAGIGRMVLSYPQMPADALAGKELDRRRICRTFGECTNGPRHGMISGCFPLDEFYKKMPQAAKLRELKKINK
ncbi:MAG: NADH:flavin oxidoreductase [Lentisphaeria bacterium]|nr:NADH:flavin oxidoreductase [Lentisphaeria bacterium]